MRLLFASNNAHKLEEVRKILPADVTVLSLKEVGFLHDIDETGTTLEANSEIKAKAIWAWLRNHPEVVVDGVFADDTGLEIAALGGQPGVYTARWAGEDCVAANNRAKALSELQGKADRSARFRTVVTLIRDGKSEQVDGIVSGRIAEMELGDGGFGYDPVFIPEGYDRTFAQLPAEVKNSISHRARAMEALRRLLVCFFCLLMPFSLFAYDVAEQGVMGQWKHFNTYTYTFAACSSEDYVFALSGGSGSREMASLFAIKKSDNSIEEINRTCGLNGTSITNIQFDNKTNKLMILYANGVIDIWQNGAISTMSDLYSKMLEMPFVINSVDVQDGIAYMGTSFGVVLVDLVKQEIKNACYIGPNASALNVTAVTQCGGKIYALADNQVYVAETQSIIENYANWSLLQLPAEGVVSHITSAYGTLYVSMSGRLWNYRDNAWKSVYSYTCSWLTSSNNHLMAYIPYRSMLVDIMPDNMVLDVASCSSLDAIRDGDTYWSAEGSLGLCRISGDNKQFFIPDGPGDYRAVKMEYSDGKLFLAPGDRWATLYQRKATVSMFENEKWTVIPADTTASLLGIQQLTDLMDYAIDPFDNSHFFAVSYGQGVVEFRNNRPYKIYSCDTPGCTLESAINSPASAMWRYVWTSAAELDASGNLWVTNCGGVVSHSLHMMSPSGEWTALSFPFAAPETLGDMIIDSRNQNIKWILGCRSTSHGLIWFDDNGTPTNPSDDKAVVRSTFVDQYGRSFTPSFYYSMAQDRDGAIWVGTDAGIFIIEHTEFATSNRCTRVLIRRNDGTDLADYLLATETINAIAVDGANRKWLGTRSSGLYLVSPDGQEMLAHFTEENSYIPSSSVVSLLMVGETGELFVGTGLGVASFLTDASDPGEDMSEVYAYPNPVRRNYVGEITITNLMADTWVNILDAAGNLVCKTRSNGGTAVWNGCNQNGDRVASGVYTALCNSGNGKGRTVVKIMILN